MVAKTGSAPERMNRAWNPLEAFVLNDWNGEWFVLKGKEKVTSAPGEEESVSFIGMGWIQREGGERSHQKRWRVHAPCVFLGPNTSLSSHFCVLLVISLSLQVCTSKKAFTNPIIPTCQKRVPKPTNFCRSKGFNPWQPCERSDCYSRWSDRLNPVRWWG